MGDIETNTLGILEPVTPTTNAIPAQDNFSPGALPTPFVYSYDPAADSNSPYILFVHGWNMPTWEKDRWAETAYKRLYWQGYQGRFGSFRWPTDYGFTGNFNQILTNSLELDNFDSSEFNAWQSATGLLNKLSALNIQYPGHVYVLAHSMGNVLAGEALRLEGSIQVVNTYVASQAAVSAHTYDSNTNDVPDYSFTYDGVSFGPITPNIYGNWFAGNNGGGAERVISFYNTNDYALARGHWQLDQLFKPDSDVVESGVAWNYGYDGSPDDPPPWNNFWKQQFGFSFHGEVPLNIVTNINARYEVMAYAAQSYTTALGATPGSLNNIFSTVNLGRITNPRIWQPDPTGNNYTEHFWHSAEFRGDNPLQEGYWSELLGSEAFNLK